MNISQSVKNLINKECANHDKFFNDIKNYCSNRDKNIYRDKDYPKSIQCIYFLEDNARCGYFEKAVLGINPQLETLYKAEYIAKKEGYKLTNQYKKQITKDKTPVVGKVKIHCKKCKEIFLADNYRSQYCEKCKKFLSRERNRNRKLKSKNTQSAL